MSFRDDEKYRYVALKPRLFSSAAQADGMYKNRSRSFCLADGFSAENLHVSLRDQAIRYFNDRGIPWHDGCADQQGRKGTLPSNHMCCSQSSCVNALAPMQRDAGLLAAVFRTFLPDMEEVLPFAADAPFPEGSRPFLAFEWIGTEPYLDEKGRQRGANATSADFAFRFRRKDMRIQLVLGEWKYTEYYKTPLPEPGKLNATRLRVYRASFERWNAGQPCLPAYEAFFAEPFYQLMRLTLLAQEMERARREGRGEMDADVVTVVHVAPKANHDFATSFTSPAFRKDGEPATVTEAWTGLCPRTRFVAVASEDLLTAIQKTAPTALADWSDWLLTRYGWWRKVE